LPSHPKLWLGGRRRRWQAHGLRVRLGRDCAIRCHRRQRRQRGRNGWTGGVPPGDTGMGRGGRLLL